MKLYKITLIAFFACFISVGYAQKGKIRKATKEYEKFSYIKTTEILLEVAKEGHKSVDLFQKLGNSFYFNNKMEDAAKWYGELMALNEEIDPEYYFRYAQALKFNENYEESDVWMLKFYKMKSDDSRGRAFAATVDYLEKIEEANKDFEVKNVDFNSAYSDFGTTQYKNQLIFASTRGEDGKTYKWNDQPFLDLYSVEKQSDGTYSNLQNYDDELNTPYHESTPSFTPDDKIMFFTRNNLKKEKLKKDNENVSRLQIFRSRLQDDGTWGKIESVHFNSTNYSVAHPSVNVRGTKLYFASDMPGTIGKSDLYVVDINADGTLGEPVNLGSKINTEGHETFPFINEKGDLFFSSNGYPGLGGLDVYVIRDFENKFERAGTLVAENLAKPINSPQDDFAYYENLGTQEGFFSSNRPGGKGDDDIYSFKAKAYCDQLLVGIVKEEATKELLPDATVILFDASGNEIGRKIAQSGATFTFELECEKEYLIRGEKENYVSDEKRFTTPSTKQDLELELNLNKDLREIEIGDDLAKLLDIPIIYFDFDKANIKPSAALELQKVITVMKKYPNMKIDVRSHTDSRGTRSYNQDLSSRRNKSTIDYIISVGKIDASRISGKGYGESLLTNRCADGVPCTELEHKLNRRSEFIILSID